VFLPRASRSIKSCIPCTNLVYLALKLIYAGVRRDVGWACPALAPQGLEGISHSSNLECRTYLYSCDPIDSCICVALPGWGDSFG
jgi:hypothetical protein